MNKTELTSTQTSPTAGDSHENGGADSDPLEPVASARLQVMQEIAKKRRAEFGLSDPEGEQETDGGEGHVETGESNLPTGNGGELASPEVLPKGLVRRADGSFAIRLKVDGQEREEDFERVLAGAQKLAAADARLMDASLRQQEANALLLQTQAQAQAMQEQWRARDAQPSASPPDSLKQGVREAFSRLVEGEDDAAVERLTTTLAQALDRPAPPPSMTAEQVRLEAAAAARNQLQADRITGARSRFLSEPAYQDLVTNPEFFGMIDRQTARIVQERPESMADPYGVMVEAAQSVRDWLQSVVAKPPVSTPARSERKAKGIPAVTPAMARVPLEEPAAPSVPTMQDRVQEIMRRRGQLRD